jgi:hypothetical protein
MVQTAWHPGKGPSRFVTTLKRREKGSSCMKKGYGYASKEVRSLEGSALLLRDSINPVTKVDAS